MSLLTDVKNQIKTYLEEMQRAEVLKEVQVDDFRGESIFDRDITAYPCAILTTAEIDNAVETNRDNIRTYSFDVVFIQKSDNIKDPTEIEDLIETILDKFDNKPTLAGKANAGLQPATSRPAAVKSRGNDLIFFVVTLRARVIKELSF